MRTTIDIPDAQYASLRALAARRGMRGFSPLISEAIDLLLEREDRESIDAALALAGTLDEPEADRLEAHVGELRARPARVSRNEDGRPT